MGDGQRVAAIVNPAAASGRSLRIWQAVEPRLRTAGIVVDIWFTRKTGDGTTQAHEALDAGHSTLLAVGGDGTLHEVVNALWHQGGVRSDVRIGVVPAGTGMDFARNAHRGPSRMTVHQAALRVLVEPGPRQVS